jgi:hypothetical protein
MQDTFVHFGINFQPPFDSFLELELFEDYFQLSCSGQAVCMLGYLVELAAVEAAALGLIAVVVPLAAVAGIAIAVALVEHFKPQAAKLQLVAARQVTIGQLAAKLAAAG